MFFVHGCEGAVSSESNNINEELCFIQLINNNWELVLYNNGTVKNITNNLSDDYLPSCSPDGNYIAWSYSNPIGGRDIYLYDILKEASYNLTPGIEYSADSPIWLNNTKIIYNYKKSGEIDNTGENGTYIIDTRNGNNKQILKTEGKVFFCSNENDFFYCPYSKVVYKTNINGDYNEVFLNLASVGEEYTNIYDYDPIREKFLLLIAQTTRVTNIIAEYDVNAGTIDTMSVAETGYYYLEPKYSNDFSKIITLARNYEMNISKILLLKGDKKKELVVLQNEKEWLNLYDNIFSPTDEKIIYSKNTQTGNEYYYWFSDLYIYDLSTGHNTFIGRGVDPVWVP